MTTKPFKPYIHVEGETSIPRGITLFAATGAKWNLIEVPEEIATLAVGEQIEAVFGLMRAYLKRYGGQCPFFGGVRGFRFVRENDSIRFGADGSLIERVEGAFNRPHVELWIGNKTVESLFN